MLSDKKPKITFRGSAEIVPVDDGRVLTKEDIKALEEEVREKIKPIRYIRKTPAYQPTGQYPTGFKKVGHNIMRKCYKLFGHDEDEDIITWSKKPKKKSRGKKWKKKKG